MSIFFINCISKLKGAMCLPSVGPPPHRKFSRIYKLTLSPMYTIQDDPFPHHPILWPSFPTSFIFPIKSCSPQEFWPPPHPSKSVQKRNYNIKVMGNPLKGQDSDIVLLWMLVGQKGAVSFEILGCIFFFNFDLSFEMLFAYEHKLVLVSGAVVWWLKFSSFLLHPLKMPPFGVFGSYFCEFSF